MSGKILLKSFYDRNPTIVARDLLWKKLVRNLAGELLISKIVETEAYLPEGDLASHGSKKFSEAKKSLYLDAGHAYVYTIHKQNLFNVVTEGKDQPGAVLIRGVEPLVGVDIMLKNREMQTIKWLTNGPGKVCQAMWITRVLDGINLCSKSAEIYLMDGENLEEVIVSKRVWITKNVEPLFRYYIKDNMFVSKGPIK